MDFLVGTSLIAAFIAGLAALFAPCCITVLLPSYLGSIFRERSKVFLMTFIFFLGVLTVFLPLGFGSAVFGQLLSKYHNAIFIIGSIFLLALGLSMILGLHLSLPFHVNPTLKNHHPLSVFLLGILSGVATTCCAPVLAGVMALSALPGSIFWGIMYTLSYVLGMVMPLFFIASFLDRSTVTKKFMRIRRPISYALGSIKISLTISEAISGGMFIVMGIVTMILAFTNKLTVHTALQTNINIYLTKLLNAIRSVIGMMPEYIWAIIFMLILTGIIFKAFKTFKKEKYEQQNSDKFKQQ